MSAPSKQPVPTKEDGRPTADFMVALNRRLVISDEDLEAGPSFSSFKSVGTDPEKRPSSTIAGTLARRLAKGAGPPKAPRRLPAGAIDVATAPKGVSPALSSIDDPDMPPGPSPPPAAGMRPRNELMFDADKEYFREHRRVVFDFDYWRSRGWVVNERRALQAHMRSTTRYKLTTHWTRYRTLGTLNLFPFGHILASVAGPSLAITGVAGAVYAAASLHLGEALVATVPWLAAFPFKLNDAPIAISGSILPLLLVFRTNNSAIRYDEARKMWGLLLNRTRDLAREAIAFFPRDAVTQKLTFARWLMVYSIALKCHLRPYDNLKADLDGLLTQREMELFMSADHKVVCCQQVLSEIIESVPMADAQRLQMHDDITTFNDILGGCERLLRTPIPLSYTRNSTRFLVLCCLFFPFGTVTKLGLAVVPATAFVTFFFLGTDEVGNEIEEPFSILPLDTIAAKSRQDITELMNKQTRNRDFQHNITMAHDCGAFKRAS